MSSHKALTLEDMIGCFTDQNNEVDSKLLNVLLYTFRSYCEPMYIIKLINKRLDYLNDEDLGPDCSSGENNGFTRAIIIFFNMWLTMPFAYDFYEFPNFRSLNELLTSSRRWLDKIVFIKSSPTFTHSIKRLEELIDNVLVNFNAMDVTEQSDYHEMPVDCQFRDSYPFNNPLKNKDVNKTLLDFSPETIADNLSYLDKTVLQKLRLPELVKYTRKQPAPSVSQIINTYNQLYNIVKLTVKHPVVVTRILDQCKGPGLSLSDCDDDTFSPESTAIKNDQRHNVIEKWIFTAQVLHRLRNFSSLVAILTALNSTELKSCMNILKINKSTKLTILYQSLLKAIEPYINQNKEDIHDLRCHVSEIPYLGIYLRNMTYINDGFPDYVQSSVKVYSGNTDRLINIDKCRRQFDVMVQVKLFSSSLNFNNIKEDGVFSDWYLYIQIESRKTQRYSSDADLIEPTLSLEGLKFLDSNESLEKMDESTISYCKSKSKSSHRCRSYERLNFTGVRHRTQSSPLEMFKSTLSRNRSIEASLSNDGSNPKVATVKLKEKRNNPNKTSINNHSNRFPSFKVSKSGKPKTVSNCTTEENFRPPLSNLTRSSTFIDVNLDAILYKKIKIYDNDRTGDFIGRVLDKFGKSKLLPKDFEVVQFLDNGKEIIIAFDQHLFYALAEQSEYLIEVRLKEIISG